MTCLLLELTIYGFQYIVVKVNVTVDYIRPASPATETVPAFSERTCATVTIGGINIAEALVSKGLATVIRYRQDDDQRSSHYDELLAAEARAIKNGKGLHSKKEVPIHRVADISGDTQKAKQFLPFLQRAGRSEAVVEYVFSGSRLKLYLPKETCLITFLLADQPAYLGVVLGPGGEGDSKAHMAVKHVSSGSTFRGARRTAEIFSRVVLILQISCWNNQNMSVSDPFSLSIITPSSPGVWLRYVPSEKAPVNILTLSAHVCIQSACFFSVELCLLHFERGKWAFPEAAVAFRGFPQVYAECIVGETGSTHQLALAFGTLRHAGQVFSVMGYHFGVVPCLTWQYLGQYHSYWLRHPVFLNFPEWILVTNSEPYWRHRLYLTRPLLPLPSCDPCNCIVIALPGGCCFVWSFDTWDLIGTQYVGDLSVSLPNHCVRRKNVIVEYHISLVSHCELLQSGREGDLSLFLVFYHTYPRKQNLQTHEEGGV
ncbi:hypothetical protein PANDA_001270 [Ailuropoda melanoleuca]|uniref:TNase-like domain-containing protein n=1 Tax=Ailuropoda melanoleuca TaxID=9646 RepID=D2GWR1_AILME|nr:hypothetical protein PANDA_001270 [Ailuropoda melanoleuca]